MRKPRTGLGFVLAGLVVLASALAMAPSESSLASSADNPWSVNVERLLRLVWSEPQGEGSAEGVYLWRRLSHSSATRLLVQMRSGDRLTLTESSEMTEGRSKQTIVDEASGWFLTIALQTPLRYESWSEMADSRNMVAQFEELIEKGLPYRTELVVEATGVGPQRIVSEEWEGNDPESSLDRIESRGLGRRLASKAPRDLGRIIREVRGVVCPTGDASRFCSVEEILSIAEILSDRYRPSGVELGPSQETALPGVSVEVLETRPEISFTRKDLEFLKRFDSFDPDRSLAGTYAERLTEEEHPEPP